MIVFLAELLLLFIAALIIILLIAAIGADHSQAARFASTTQKWQAIESFAHFICRERIQRCR